MFMSANCPDCSGVRARRQGTRRIRVCATFIPLDTKGGLDILADCLTYEPA